MLESWPSIIFSLELVSASVGTITVLLQSVHTMKRHDMAAVSIQSADFTQLQRVRLQRSLLVPQEKASWINAMNTSKEELISGVAKNVRGSWHQIRFGALSSK